MLRMMRELCFVTVLILLSQSTVVFAQLQNESRLALVIGNANYKTSPLANPVNDARLMERTLKNLGFTVIKTENASRREMLLSIRDFGDRLKQSGGVGLFYFAGHGVQIRGVNYLVPVDADIKSEDEVAFDSIDAQSVLEKMETAKNTTNVIILDACRDNPFSRGSRSTTVGLATMNAPNGSIVAYSTAPGSVASDGSGANGLYTKHLATAMQESGLQVEEVFKKVRVAVRRDSNNRQTPWENTALEGQFFFRLPAQGQSPAASLPAQALPLDQISPPKPVTVATASSDLRIRDEKGNYGVVVLKDLMTGQETRTEVHRVPSAVNVTRWSTGDEVDMDGRVTTVRIGSYLGKVSNGQLWKMPLQNDTTGVATIRFEGMDDPGRIEWRITERRNGIFALEARVYMVVKFGVGGTVTRSATWRADLLKDLPIPINQNLDMRGTGTGVGPERYSGELVGAVR